MGQIRAAGKVHIFRFELTEKSRIHSVHRSCSPSPSLFSLSPSFSDVLPFSLYHSSIFPFRLLFSPRMCLVSVAPSFLSPPDSSSFLSVRKDGLESECSGGSRSSSISDNNERWTLGSEPRSFLTNTRVGHVRCQFRIHRNGEYHDGVAS